MARKAHPDPEPAPNRRQKTTTLTLDDETRARLDRIGEARGIRGRSAVIRYLAAQECNQLDRRAAPIHPPGDLIA